MLVLFFSESVIPDYKVRSGFNKNNLIALCFCKDFKRIILEQYICQCQDTTQRPFGCGIIDRLT